jgi:hypothetical protein
VTSLAPHPGSYWRLDALVGRYLLAVQEGGPTSTEATEVFQCIGEAWADIQGARAYAEGHMRETGRPLVTVIRTEAGSRAAVVQAAEGA